MKICFWNAPEVAPKVAPELPVNRKYRRAQRYYRWLLPEPVPLTKMSFCIFSGSDTGTTAKPEVPALLAELPPRRDDLFEDPWQAVLGGPVLPVPRAFFSNRW